MIKLNAKALRIFVPKGTTAMALWPIVLFFDPTKKADETITRHERIHLRQQLELFIIPFYLIYLLEFLYWYLLFFNRDKAYRNISFEREAYRNDRNPAYLKKRSGYAMWR